MPTSTLRCLELLRQSDAAWQPIDRAGLIPKRSIETIFHCEPSSLRENLPSYMKAPVPIASNRTVGLMDDLQNRGAIVFRDRFFDSTGRQIQDMQVSRDPLPATVLMANAMNTSPAKSLMTSCPKATFRDSLIKSSRNASRSSRASSPLIRRCRRPPPRSSAYNLRLLRLYPPLQSPTLVRERMNTSTVLPLLLRWLRALFPCSTETSSTHSLRRAICGTICG
jgi:hypothetical protein